MNQKQLNQWRTVLVAVILGLVQGAAFLWGTLHPDAVVEKMYGSLTWANVLLVALVAGKSLGQHAASAGGLRGLLGALGGGPAPQAAPALSAAPGAPPALQG